MNLQEIINDDKPILFDFYADWCGPCKVQAPILEDLKQRIGDKAHIIKINVDNEQAFAARFQIRSIPTLIIMKNKEIKWRKSGVTEAYELESLLIDNQ